VGLLDEDFVVPDREVTVKERDAKPFVDVFVDKAAPDFGKAHMIVYGQNARAR
jgi:hypothetical protein